MRCRFFCARSGTEGEAAWRCAGKGLCGRRGVHRAACGRASALRGRAEVFGRACRCAGARGSLRRGMGCEVGGFNAHSPQQHARTCIIIYTSALSTPSNRGHGAERRPCEHPSPAKTSAPAPSAFIFPRPRSHFPRMAFGLPLNDVRPCRPVVHTSPAYPSAAPTKTLASRSSSYPQWVIHGKVIHIVARRPVQNVLALAPAHAYI